MSVLPRVCVSVPACVSMSLQSSQLCLGGQSTLAASDSPERRWQSREPSPRLVSCWLGHPPPLAPVTPSACHLRAGPRPSQLIHCIITTIPVPPSHVRRVHMHMCTHARSLHTFSFVGKPGQHRAGLRHEETKHRDRAQSCPQPGDPPSQQGHGAWWEKPGILSAGIAWCLLTFTLWRCGISLLPGFTIRSRAAI